MSYITGGAAKRKTVSTGLIATLTDYLLKNQVYPDHPGEDEISYNVLVIILQ